MNTHTIILKCQGKSLPQKAEIESFVAEELDASHVDYFGRNGVRLYSNPKAIMENLRDTIYIRLSFRHLLQLDTKHAFAVIKEALQKGFVKYVKREEHQIEVELN